MMSSTPTYIKRKYSICKVCGYITCECNVLSNCCGSAIIGDICQDCKEHSRKVKQ